MLDLHRLCRDMDDRKSPLRRQADTLVQKIFSFLRTPTPWAVEQWNGWQEDFRVIYGETSVSAHKRLDPDRLLSDYSIPPEGDREEQMRLLLFAIQTYFSLLIKTVLAAALGERGKDWAGWILGAFAAGRGVVNFCEKDWYCWPLDALDNGFDRVMEALAEQVFHYASLDSDPVRAGRDDVKRLYEALIPRQLRHALGEYYTPDWLAAYTFDRAFQFCGGEIGSLRVADPACGSGTFLLQAIARKRQAGAGLGDILETVWGFDINPLAVLTAKSNYLLAVLDLLGDGQELEIPICRADALEWGPEAKKAGLVVGNPPWINWEYLPRPYRERSQGLWSRYGLLAEKGISLSFLKMDVSDLIAYVSADRLLEEGGVLAFLVRQGVFKSARNGAGFRQLQLPDGTGLGALRVDDFSKLKVFEGAAASAAALFARKGAETAYPVPYAVWAKAAGMKRGPVDPRLPPEEVPVVFAISEQKAVPSGARGAPWLTAPEGELENLRDMLGRNPYRARTGVFTGGANGVYWLAVRAAGDGLAEVSNIQHRAKRKTQAVTVEIEDTYLYPMLKGSGIRQWQTSYDTYLLCPHTAETKLRPVPWERLRAGAPKTAGYLAAFRETLDQRKGFAGWERAIQEQAFHAVLRVGPYTFAPWKVVWKYIASSFVCAVIGTVEDPFLGKKLLIPNEKVMYVSTSCQEEAYYLCGVLSSTPVARCVRGYMNPTSISAHVLGRLRIPKFDAGNPVHREIAGLCQAGHRAEEMEGAVRRIDALAGEL